LLWVAMTIGKRRRLTFAIGSKNHGIQLRLPMESSIIGTKVRRFQLGLCLRAVLPVCLTAGSVFAVVLPVPAAKPKNPEPVNFNRDIRPILAEKCLACHGRDPNALRAGLNLDRREIAISQLVDGVHAIVPGHPDDSELVARINADPEERMPPVSSNKSLTPDEKDLLTRWIKEGAVYEPHWGFVAPVRPNLPAVKDARWVRNDIDRFVLAELEKRGLHPSPAADKETMLRRVSLDLTGLPPTTAELDAFLADKSPGAYEKVVDRLLASPRFGERMAMDWMDYSRYADSNGYQADFERFQWRWRDWVINAFNNNMPFDEFTVDQIAGDLLPNATQDQKVATGFNRNHRLNTEGGVIAEEWRVEGVIDRAATTSTVWLGLTAGCARCHDHKYDPISQKEFYSLAAYFNSVPETGTGVEQPVNHPPFIPAPYPEQLADQKRLSTLITGLRIKEAPMLAKNAKFSSDWVPSGESIPESLISSVALKYEFDPGGRKNIERIHEGGTDDSEDVFDAVGGEYFYQGLRRTHSLRRLIHG